jgi:hypothetical protein
MKLLKKVSPLSHWISHVVFTCKIHAENLTDPAKARLPIKITTATVSCEDKAKQLVEDFTANTPFAIKLKRI